MLTICYPKNIPFVSSTGMTLLCIRSYDEPDYHLYEIMGLEDDGTYILRFIV